MTKTIKVPRGLGVKQTSLKGGGVMLSGGAGGTAAANKYTDDAIAGISGVLAGKNCTIQSKTAIEGGTRIVFAWTADNGASRTESLDVMDGTDGNDGTDAPTITNIVLNADNSLTVSLSDGSSYTTNAVSTVKGDDGEKGDDGFSPQITVKESTESNYILHIKTADDEFDTVNLKGAGGGGGAISELSDVSISTLKDGQSLRYSALAGKWVNADGTEIASLSDIADVDISSIADGQVIVWDASANKWVNSDVANPLQFDVMPTAANYAERIVQFTGTTTANYTQGYFYRSTPSVVAGSVVYSWVQTAVQPSNSDYENLSNLPKLNGITVQGEKISTDYGLQSQVQYEALPAASVAIVGKIAQYVGTTTADYKSGYFYRVQYDSDTASYKWVKLDVSDNALLSAAVSALETNQGDMSQLAVSGASNLVAAINALNSRELTSIVYTEPNLVLTYASGTTFSFNVRDSILRETQLGELANVNDAAVADTNLLQYDAATLGYKPYDIVTALSNLLQASKDYTDQEIGLAVQDDAFICDSKPTCALDSSTGKYTVIYYQNSVAHTTTDTTARFYYKSSDSPYCSSWFVTGDGSVDPVEFTYLISSPNFDDYINKNTDITSTYTEDMADKTKVPDVAALDALLALVKTALSLKVNTADIEDSLNSQSADKVLSAKQGYVLKAEVDAKNDRFQYSTMPTASSTLAGMVVQYVGASSAAYTKGFFYACLYDSENDEWYWGVLKQPSSDGYTKAEVDAMFAQTIQLVLNE